MISLIVQSCILASCIFAQTFAQWSGGNMGMGPGPQQQNSMAATGSWGQQGQVPAGSMGWGGMFRRRQEPAQQYQTCIGKNSNGDEMKVSFIAGGGSRWGGRFGMGGRTLRINAEYRSPSSTLKGQFRLVVTEFSRVEDGCSTQALGEIITDRFWWGRSDTPRGIVGNVLTIIPGHTAMSSEVVENLSFNELSGRGLALCPVNQLRDNKCLDFIPLCCKLGHDTQPANTPFVQQSQLFGQGGLGISAPGQGMGNGMNGLPVNNGVNNGFQQHF